MIRAFLRRQPFPWIQAKASLDKRCSFSRVALVERIRETLFDGINTPAGLGIVKLHSTIVEPFFWDIIVHGGTYCGNVFGGFPIQVEGSFSREEVECLRA